MNERIVGHSMAGVFLDIFDNIFVVHVGIVVKGDRRIESDVLIVVWGNEILILGIILWLKFHSGLLLVIKMIVISVGNWGIKFILT